RLRDLDQDGICELIVGNEDQNAVFARSPKGRTWERLPFDLPGHSKITDSNSISDLSLRFVDLDEDGIDDVVYSDFVYSEIFLFHSMKDGWSRAVLMDLRKPSGAALPDTARFKVKDGYENNGFWVHSRSLWWQNEDTAKLSDLVDRRSFNDLLK